MVKHNFRIINNDTESQVREFTIETRGWNGPKTETIQERANELVRFLRGSYRVERHNGLNWNHSGIGFFK